MRRASLTRRRRQFAKWRRAILRGYSSRLASKRKNLVAHLSRRADSLRSQTIAWKYYSTSLQPRSAIAARSLAELRLRNKSVRRGAKGLKPLFYAAPFRVLQALRVSRRRLKVASRAAERLTYTETTLHAFALGRTTAAICSVERSLLAARRARCMTAVELRSRKLFEGRLYRRQLKLRLPCTNVSRRNLRHGGHVLFARNTLKTPTTLAGKRNQLLASTTPWVLGGRSAHANTSLLPFQLRRIEKRGDTLPRA